MIFHGVPVVYKRSHERHQPVRSYRFLESPARSSSGPVRIGRRVARQSRYAGRDRRQIGAPLLEGVPARQTSHRGRYDYVEICPQRHHPAAAAWTQRPRLRKNMEPRQERIAAEDDHPLTGREADGGAHAARQARGGRLGDALRQPVDPFAPLGAHRPRVRAYPGGSAVSAICRRDQRNRLRPSLSRAHDDALAAGGAYRPALFRRSGLHRGAGRVRRRRIYAGLPSNRR